MGKEGVLILRNHWFYRIRRREAGVYCSKGLRTLELIVYQILTALFDNSRKENVLVISRSAKMYDFGLILPHLP